MTRKEFKPVARAAYLEKHNHQIAWKLATGRLVVNTEFEIMEYLDANTLGEALETFKRARSLIQPEQVEKAATDLRINKKRAEAIIKKTA